jgi:hypothetical protein
MVENLETGELNFLYSSGLNDEGDIFAWLPLLEKAYAKAYGGYCNIQRPSMMNSLQEFTGSTTFSVELENLAPENSEDPESIKKDQDRQAFENLSNN